MEDNKPLVIVLGRNYSTALSVIRSLGAAGYTVDLVASAYKSGESQVAACSKYVRNSVEVVSKKVKDGEKDEAFLREILKYKGKYDYKPVLFPTDDYTTSVMDQSRSELEEYFIMPTIVGGGDGCLTHCMDKEFQAGLAKQVGLLTPEEWIIPLNDEIVIPEEMIYPCFCKPMESVSGYKREMKVCKTKESLTKHLESLKEKSSNRSILVQEFLSIDDEIDLSGVCLDQEIIIPAFIKKINVAKYERGVTLAGRLLSVEEMGDLYEKIVEMMKKFRYFGMFDMEFNVVKGKIYFNEVNLRSGGPNFAYFKCGANLPALFVKEAMGQKHSPEEEKLDVYGKNFIYEKVAWEDYMHGHMSKSMLKSRISQADIKLLSNSDDPKPAKLFDRKMKLIILSKKKKEFEKNLKKAKKNHRKNKRRRLKKIRNSAVAKQYRRTRRKVRRFKKKTVKEFKRNNKQTRRTIRKIVKPIVNVMRNVKYRILGYPQAKKSNRRNPLAEKPRVIVAGRNYCSNLCMARSLGEAGYEVEVLRIFQVKPKRTNLMKLMKPDAYSKYVKAYHVCISKRKPANIVKRLVKLSDKYRKMLLIPTDDLVANIADTNYNKLSKYYYIPNINHQSGEINRLMSKEVQKQLAREAGLPVLNSCMIAVEKGGDVVVPETVTYPCFIKPNISKNSSKSRMRKCDSEEELVGYLKEFSRRKSIEMLVEDYVEIKKEFSILGLSTKNGVLAPGFFCAEEGGHNERRGVAMVGKMLPCSQEQQLIDACSEFIGTLGYEGLFDVDLIQTQDGKLYFVELNLRYGASGYAVTQSGVNLPGMLADYMCLDKPVDMNCKIEEPNKLFISEKVMIEEYQHGLISFSDMMERMKQIPIHFVKNAEDMAPYNHFKKFYPIAAIMRKLGK